MFLKVIVVLYHQLEKTFEELVEEIQKIFSKAAAADEAEDNKINSEFFSSSPMNFMDAIWPAAMKCETFFRNSNDIRALECQAGVLMHMENNVYRGAYLQMRILYAEGF